MRERMIVERNRAKESFIWAMTLIILPMLGSSCSEEQQFSGNSQLETTFQLESNSALGGSITIQQAYLKLDHIAISGVYSFVERRGVTCGKVDKQCADVSAGHQLSNKS